MKFSSEIERNDKLRLFIIPIEKTHLLALNNESPKKLYNQRVTIIVNDQVKWKAGTVALGNERAYVTISKNQMRELGVHFGDQIEVQLVKDETEFGMEVPTEFTALLNQDIEGNERFQKLSKGKQRALIYLIIQLKSSEKRIEKSIFLMENLKRAPVGNETMRHILGKDLS